MKKQTFGVSSLISDSLQPEFCRALTYFDQTVSLDAAEGYIVFTLVLLLWWPYSGFKESSRGRISAILPYLPRLQGLPFASFPLKV